MSRVVREAAVVAILWVVTFAAAGCGTQDAGVADESQAPDLQDPIVEPASAEPDVAAVVDAVLEEARHPWLRWPELEDVSIALGTLYGEEPDRLIWFAGDRSYPALEGTIDALADAEARGLDPADYDAERIASEWGRLQSGAEVSAEDRALFDLAVTVGILREIEAVHIGRVDPRTIDWGYDVEPKKLDRPVVLRDARDGEGLPAALDRLEPSFPHYQRNKQTLARYRALLASGEPDPVPELTNGRTKVAPGDPWEGVPRLAARLRFFGDLPSEAAASGVAPDGTPLYDGALVDAVRSFQERHVLDADGVVGKGTLEALNVPFTQRLRQLELALERGRWLPTLSDRPTVFVNVPLFRLWATDPASGEEPLRMNVVVGKSLNHRTPIFLGEMAYIVFRPYWNPPYGITRNELVPHARRDPSYMETQNLEIVASGADDAVALPPTPENLDAVVAGKLHIRQKPGPHNSLGLAKFIFPNAESVYMHGTPTQQLFSRTRRDFSHGCIRLERPADLAAWVLRDEPEWTPERIDAAMKGERPKQVNLDEPLLVVLFYDTVHVNSEGVVHLINDIYGHDAMLDRALEQGYPYPEQS
ncbi:MAG TPA: L,D-transpeptidase family protein [Vicinamibacteria bacterium]|nr:L,D-transpeptidase family protein [Vicinamibacteria bacterium]